NSINYLLIEVVPQLVVQSMQCLSGRGLKKRRESEVGGTSRATRVGRTRHALFDRGKRAFKHPHPAGSGPTR
ncbi:hypothetical protein PFISCL1PPCAC_4358, partial [Pristionchus fissidentatus]